MWPDMDQHFNTWAIDKRIKNPKGGTGFLMDRNKRNKKRKKRRNKSK